MTAVLPHADAVASALANGAWQASLPAAGSSGDGCGEGFSGLSSAIAPFVRPLEELFESVCGDPGGLYRASMTWEVYAADIQQVSMTMSKALAEMDGRIRGTSASTTEAVLTVLASGAHSIADWSKVVSQVLQACVRIVEIMRSIVCAAFELIIAEAGSLGDLLFEGFPWDVEQKMRTLNAFADHCAQVIDTALSNVDRVFQLLRELVRLLLDLYRAMVPFHRRLEELIGIALHDMPPGEIPGVGEITAVIPATGALGDKYGMSQTPFPESEQEFRFEHDIGYEHSYDCGETRLDTRELNALLRDKFGRVFGPSRLGDNSQLGARLSKVDQLIHTSLFGLEIPGITAGDIVVEQISEDGFVVGAAPNHPEYPGEVAFRLRNVGGRAVFEVTGAYSETILTKLQFEGNSNAAFAGISDVSIWADMAHRLEDIIKYGEEKAV